MDSITLPRGIGAERFVAKALRAAIPLASLGVLGFLILGASHPGSSAIAVLVLFAFALLLATGSVFFWKSMVESKLILGDALVSLKLALALTTTTMVFVRSAPQGMVYGALLLLLFMASVGLKSHADRREERANQSSSKTATAVEAEPVVGADDEPTAASKSELTGKAESPTVPVRPNFKARLESSLTLLKRNS